jgi:hypothetical protein
MYDAREQKMFKVSYIHMRGYRVSRIFDTREAAQEFINANAMVFPLPGCRGVEEVPR